MAHFTSFFSDFETVPWGMGVVDCETGTLDLGKRLDGSSAVVVRSSLEGLHYGLFFASVAC